MKIHHIVNHYHLQCLVQENYNSLNDLEQKFLTNMLVLAVSDSNISAKQSRWLENLVIRMKKINQLRKRSPRQRTRPDHSDHETELRPGSGPHAGRLWCVKCSKHIQWITQQQMATLQK
jgi:hypothetical protein